MMDEMMVSTMAKQTADRKASLWVNTSGRESESKTGHLMVDQTVMKMAVSSGG